MIDRLRGLYRAAYWSYRSVAEAYVGTATQRRTQRRLERKKLSLVEALRRLSKYAEFEVDSASEPEPVFVLSCGWRNGSTLLQRLLCSSGEVMMFGEPYGREGLVDSMTTPLRRFAYASLQHYNPAPRTTPPRELASKWIATFNPRIERMHDAHRTFFCTLFGQTASELGCERWGFKSTRLGYEHAVYLRWLFPRARIIFLYRNPYDAYASFRGKHFHQRWPDRPVFTTLQWARHWANTMTPMLNHYEEVDALLVCYDDLLRDPAEVERIERYAGLDLDASVLDRKVGSSYSKGCRKNRLPWLQRRTLRRIVGPVAYELGFEAP